MCRVCLTCGTTYRRLLYVQMSATRFRHVKEGMSRMVDHDNVSVCIADIAVLWQHVVSSYIQVWQGLNSCLPLRRVDMLIHALSFSNVHHSFVFPIVLGMFRCKRSCTNVSRTRVTVWQVLYIFHNCYIWSPLPRTIQTPQVDSLLYIRGDTAISNATRNGVVVNHETPRVLYLYICTVDDANNNIKHAFDPCSDLNGAQDIIMLDAKSFVLYAIIWSLFTVIQQVLILWYMIVPDKYQRCGLRQLGRTSNVIMAHLGMTIILYSATRVLRIREKAKTYETTCLDCVDYATRWAPFESPPARVTTEPKYEATLIKFLLPHDMGKNIDDTSEEEVIHAKAYIKVFNGDKTLPEPVHYCPGPIVARTKNMQTQGTINNKTNLVQ